MVLTGLNWNRIKPPPLSPLHLAASCKQHAHPHRSEALWEEPCLQLPAGQDDFGEGEGSLNEIHPLTVIYRPEFFMCK